jgi:isopenicillin-N N-acyltransferase-like protein
MAARHFPFFEFAGSSYDVGYGYGHALREGIQLQLKETLEGAQRSGLDRERALAWSLAQLAKIEHVGGAGWIEELQGLAAGAGIPIAAAAALQVRPGSGFMPQEACTSIGVSRDASVTGVPLGAQNRDLVPAYRPRMCVLLLRPSGRPAVLMHSVPGELGGVGINEYGVALFANSLYPKSGRNWQSPPVTRRALLECRDAEEAAARAQGMDGPAVGSLLLVDAAGRIRNLEMLPEAVRVLAQDRGVFAHTNHCLDATLAEFEVDPLPSPGSRQRRERAAALLAAAGPMTFEGLKQVLADHASQPEPVCRHGEPPTRYETASCLVAEPATRTLHLSYGPPCTGAFATYALA